MTDLDEMIAFTRAQILARRTLAEAATSGPWQWDLSERGSDQGPRLVSDTDDDPDGVISGWASWHGPNEIDAYGLEISAEDRAHIEANDPRDVIARCDSDLAILDEINRTFAYEDYGHALADSVVRLLAQGYHHRDGWKAEWSA